MRVCGPLVPEGDFHMSLAALGKIWQDNLQPNVITYNALISACGKGRMVEVALQLFDDMRQHGVQPDVITYNALISACGNGRMTERALQFLDEMQQQGLQPDVIIYRV